MLATFRVLFLICAVVVHVSSTVIEVVRTQDGRDIFSNPGCVASYCLEQSVTCSDGSCCMCACPHDTPNYVVNKWVCKTNDQVNTANCEYSINPPNSPLAVLPLTEGDTDQIAFTDSLSARRVICNSTVTIGHWEYADAFGKWRPGGGNVFSVEYTLVGGPERNKRDLSLLKWSGRVDAKYAGLIIKLSLSCENKDVGCFLAKIGGTHNYNTTAVPTLPPKPKTTPLPTTAQTQSTTNSSGDSLSQVNNNNNNNDKQKSSSQAKVLAIPIFATLGGIICLVGLSCMAVMLYKRRKRREGRDTDSVNYLTPNEEPIYAEVNKDFENPVYCDPALDQSVKKAQLGPLPSIPGNGSTYEPLDSLTRVSPDYDNPIEDSSTDNADYDNPPATGNSRTLDYDNPQVQSIQESSDYDNPPQDGHPVSSDYDNPPVTGGDADNIAKKDDEHTKTEYDTPRTQPTIETSPTAADLDDYNPEDTQL